MIENNKNTNELNEINDNIEVKEGEKSKKKSKKRKKRPFTLVEKIILIVLILVFLTSAGILGWKLYKDYKADADFQKISTEKEENDLTIAELQELNPDTIGWLTIEGTIIDYPVMYTPNNPEYYLYVNFENEYSGSGTLFLDATCSIEDPTTYNWMIHGHHMKTGTMFGSLVDYEDMDYLEEHPTFTFETIDGEKTYKIIAVLETEIFAADYEGFAYYNYRDIMDESSYNEYIDGLWENSLYTVGEKPEYPSQLISLSTCAYHTDEGRFVVVGVEVE